MVGHAQGWESWEARRASLPKRPDPETREARQDARLLLMVVRARFAAGNPAFEHAGVLEAAAQDPRLTSRLRLRAAEALGRLRLAGMRGP